MAAVNPKPTRRERAAATRERMLVAAIEVFGESGYAGARMTDIAARAGVAVQTLYFTFHTKPELLSECIKHGVLGPDELPPTMQPFWFEMLNARSGRAALAAFARGNSAIVFRVAVIDEVAEAATHEPEVAEIVDHSEWLRREGYAEVIDVVGKRFGLRAGLSAAEATDLLLMYGNSHTYLALSRAGWSDERFVDWLADALARDLLARPGRARG